MEETGKDKYVMSEVGLAFTVHHALAAYTRGLVASSCRHKS
jgi:hypothetical protein